MAGSTLIPINHYMKTTYRPDCDYVDGEVRERNVGIRPHSDMLAILSGLFYGQRSHWNVVALPSVRVQVSSTRILVPDVTVLRRPVSSEAIIHTVPLLCIEIVAREDTLREMQERVDDYAAMGIEHVWVVDPVRRIAYVGSSSGFVRPANDELAILGTPIRIALGDLFAQVDDLEAGR